MNKQDFQVAVDYSRAWLDLVRGCNFNEVDKDLKGYRFKVTRRPNGNVEMAIVEFDKSLSLGALKKRLSKAGYRGAEALELLAFVAEYRTAAMKYDVLVAPGALCKLDEDNNLGALCTSWNRDSYENDSLRLGIDGFGIDWGGWEAGTAFLAVKK